MTKGANVGEEDRITGLGEEEGKRYGRGMRGWGGEEKRSEVTGRGNEVYVRGVRKGKGKEGKGRRYESG